MLKLLRSIWSMFWSTVNGFLWTVLRFFGHYPPVPKAAPENIMPDDVQRELQNARDRKAAAEPANPDLETRVALIWGYANASVDDRTEIDLGILPEHQRNALMLMSEIDLLQLAGNRLLCAKWHLLDGKFPRRKKTAPEIPEPSKGEVVSTEFIRRMRDRRSQRVEDDVPQPSYGYRM